MGVAIIGGLLLSTVLTLIVIPAIFTYVDRFRVWATGIGSRVTTNNDAHTAGSQAHAGKAPSDDKLKSHDL